MIRIATAPVSPRRSYQYDTLGRPTSRTLARQGATRNDVFTYNDRSELISDVVDGTGLNGWDYDNIGNRLLQQQGSACDTYTSNALNQYTAIEDETHDVFSPTYDDDGNQTRIKTSTGIWNVTYNAKNRPVLFTKDDNSVSVACTYDYMGRRATKVVTENGRITSHRFLYRGYLQVACCDRKRSTHPCLWLITWDPTQDVATRPLAIQKDGTWYTYGWDLTKNIWEAYNTSGYIGTAYTYTAYGQVTSSGSITQPIQWSSEYNDMELGLVYYNFRHYNPVAGRWIGRDKTELTTQHNLYEMIANNAVRYIDRLGLYVVLCFAYHEGTITGYRMIGTPPIKEELTPEIKNVFSGNYDEKTKINHCNNPSSQHMIDQGPIPVGEYWIGFEYIPETHVQDDQRGGNYKWHRLYGDDGKGGKSYTNIPVYDSKSKKYVNRGCFNLHTGCESNGCVTIESEVKDRTSPAYPQSKAYDKLNKFINEAKTPPLNNPRKKNDTYLGILLVREYQVDCVKSIKQFEKNILSLIVIFFYFMGAIVQAENAVDTNSQVVLTALTIEKIANTHHALSQEDVLRNQIECVIYNINDEQKLFALAIIFHEGYSEFLESPADKLMFFAQQYIVLQLAKMGTEKAYYYFKTLKTLYGRDGAAYRGYRILEYRYLKQYSEDAEVKNAKSEGKWL